MLRSEAARAEDSEGLKSKKVDLTGLIIPSSAFASAIGEPKKLLVSVGRYALRGVGKPQDLYTLDREREKSASLEDDSRR